MTEFTTEDRETLESLDQGYRNMASVVAALGSPPSVLAPPTRPVLAGYQQSGPMGELYAALAKAQGAFDTVAKGRTNPHFRSKYADLASGISATREALSSNGLALFYPISGDGEAFTIHLTLAHVSGASIYCPIGFAAGKTEQETGSRRTYLTRYGVFGLLGIAGEDEDDDGNAASGREQPEQRRQEQPRKPPQQAPARPAAQAKTSEPPPPKVAPVVAQEPDTASIGPAMSEAQHKTLRELFEAKGLHRGGAVRFGKDIDPSFPEGLEKAGGAELCERVIAALTELKVGDVAKSLGLTPEVKQ
jgi:hypothetical protein